MPKSRFNPDLHHRRSIRLKGYDYSQEGLYFITLCVQKRQHLFGDISDDEMVLNDGGKMIAHWYAELENKYPNVYCHEMIIMPNHFHCIIELTCTSTSVYAPMRLPQFPTIGDVMKWFKTMTTNEYIWGVKNNGWMPFDGKLWQRNYWEHIIRNEYSYNNIANYIINNPANWYNDMLFL